LVFGALFVGATSLATGCIFVSDDDDPDPIDDVGSIEVAWTLDPAGCPPGGDTAELLAVDVATGEEFTDLVNCTDGVNTIDDLLPGLYDVSVNIVSDDRVDVFAVSAVEEDVEVIAGTINTGVPTFNILTEDAFFAFTWDLTEGGAPLACDEVPLGLVCDDGAGDCDGISATAFCDAPPGGVGECRDIAGGIDIAATLMADDSLNATQFNCEDGAGTTQPFPLGDYTIVFAVLDQDDASLLDSQAITDSLDIGNEFVDLGNVVFDF
jgi:hypothetical protein